jgi:hypothetical protein
MYPFCRQEFLLTFPLQNPAFPAHLENEGIWSIRQKNLFAELDLPNRHNAEIVLSIRQNLPNSSLLTISAGWDGLIKFWD